MDSEGPVKISTDQPIEMPDPIEATPTQTKKFEKGELISKNIGHEYAFQHGWATPEIALDRNYQNHLVPFSDYHPVTVSENQILTDVLRHTAGKSGIRTHHPLVAQVILQSFEQHPELYQAYLRS